MDYEKRWPRPLSWYLEFVHPPNALPLKLHYARRAHYTLDAPSTHIRQIRSCPDIPVAPEHSVRNSQGSCASPVTLENAGNGTIREVGKMRHALHALGNDLRRCPFPAWIECVARLSLITYQVARGRGAEERTSDAWQIERAVLWRSKGKI